MTTHRIERVNQLLRRSIGENLYRFLHGTEIDPGWLTVTRVETSNDLRHARVFISVRDHPDQRETILSRLERNRHRVQDFLAHDVRLKYTPKLVFTLDSSLELGDNVLRILHELDIDQPETQNPQPPDAPPS